GDGGVVPSSPVVVVLLSVACLLVLLLVAIGVTTWAGRGLRWRGVPAGSAGGRAWGRGFTVLTLGGLLELLRPLVGWDAAVGAVLGAIGVVSVVGGIVLLGIVRRRYGIPPRVR